MANKKQKKQTIKRPTRTRKTAQPTQAIEAAQTTQSMQIAEIAQTPLVAQAPQVIQVVQANESVVLIGKKPVMNYVVACMTFFSSGTKRVVVKARGRAISRAVDTVELLRRAFMTDLQLQGITTHTEEVTRAEGQKANVSSIEITVTKP
jgi:DNA-binding protein